MVAVASLVTRALGAATGTPPRCARPAFAFNTVNSGVGEPPYDGGALLPVCYVREYRLRVRRTPILRQNVAFNAWSSVHGRLLIVPTGILSLLLFPGVWAFVDCSWAEVLR
jgi:hypothetical protein